MKNYKNVEEYIKHTPKEFIPKLKEMRALAKKLIPKGVESIKYGMPTVEVNGKNFIHYAAMKSHLGFYPSPSGVDSVKADLKKKGIEFSKGCIRFPYDEKLPVSIITKSIKYRLKEIKNDNA